MNNICIWCGKTYPKLTNSFRRRFCQPECATKMNNAKPLKPTEDFRDFRVFQNIVNAAESPTELARLLKSYLPWKEIAP